MFWKLKGSIILKFDEENETCKLNHKFNWFFFFFFCNFGKPGLLKCKRKTYDLPCILFTNDKTQSHIQIY